MTETNDWRGNGWQTDDRLEEVVRNTTPTQRLEWLEEMIELAYESGGLARARELDQRERLLRDQRG
ncbi:MAG TPA: hypothetical protein VF618_14780 [Thermoanaerobaculia bacterium]